MILITGTARSGTSMTAGIIKLCGANGGIADGASKWNRKGFFENKAIRKTIIKPMLKTWGCDQLGQSKLPPHYIHTDLEETNQIVIWIRKQIAQIREAQHIEDPMFFKGAKLCLMWQYWDLAFPEAQWIICRRPKQDIVNSCNKTAFMNQRGYAGWDQWVDDHIERFEAMKKYALGKVVEVDTKDIAQGNFTEIKSVIQQVGLQWNEKAVSDFVDPSLFTGVK